MGAETLSPLREYGRSKIKQSNKKGRKKPKQEARGDNFNVMDNFCNFEWRKSFLKHFLKCGYFYALRSQHLYILVSFCITGPNLSRMNKLLQTPIPPSKICPPSITPIDWPLKWPAQVRVRLWHSKSSCDSKSSKWFLKSVEWASIHIYR